MIYDPTSDPDKDPAQYDLEITGSRKILAELIYYDPQQGWLRLRGKTIRYNTLTMESHVIGGSTMHYGAKRP